MFLCWHEAVLHGVGGTRFFLSWGSTKCSSSVVSVGLPLLQGMVALLLCLLYTQTEHFTRSFQAKHKTRPCGTRQDIRSSCLLEHIFKNITLYFSSNCTLSPRKAVTSCAHVVMAITAASSMQRKALVIRHILCADRVLVHSSCPRLPCQQLQRGAARFSLCAQALWRWISPQTRSGSHSQVSCSVGAVQPVWALQCCCSAMATGDLGAGCCLGCCQGREESWAPALTGTALGSLSWLPGHQRGSWGC